LIWRALPTEMSSAAGGRSSSRNLPRRCRNPMARSIPCSNGSHLRLPRCHERRLSIEKPALDRGSLRTTEGPLTLVLADGVAFTEASGVLSAIRTKVRGRATRWRPFSEYRVTREQSGTGAFNCTERQLGQVDPLRVADPRRNRAASLLVARPSRSRPTIDYELSVSPSRPFCNYAHRFACFVNAPSELL